MHAPRKSITWMLNKIIKITHVFASVLHVWDSDFAISNESNFHEQSELSFVYEHSELSCIASKFLHFVHIFLFLFTAFQKSHVFNEDTVAFLLSGTNHVLGLHGKLFKSYGDISIHNLH